MEFINLRAQHARIEDQVDVAIPLSFKQERVKSRLQPESYIPLRARVLQMLAVTPKGRREISATLTQNHAGHRPDRTIISYKPTIRFQKYRLTSRTTTTQ